MPRTENQKIKMLYVLEYLWKYTDENNGVSVGYIIDYLDEKGITADRRSIYRDIYALRDVYGLDIDGEQGGRFKLMSRQFDVDELQLIAQCVYGAKFISKDKAKQLIEVLCDFCSEEQGVLIKEEIYTADRVKTTNEATLRITSRIKEAMSKRENGKVRVPTKIAFKYTSFNIGKKLTQTERRKGSYYIVSPYQFVMNDGNMYLMGYDDDKEKMLTFRIDRMKDVKVLKEPRSGNFDAAEMETYTKRVFNMIGGQRHRVEIRFTNDKLDTVIDRFGMGDDVTYYPKDKTHFAVITDVEVSDAFYSWICGFRKKAVILNPPEVVEGFQNFLKDIQNKYE